MTWLQKLKCTIKQVNNILNFPVSIDFNPATNVLTSIFANGKEDTTTINITPSSDSTLESDVTATVEYPPGIEVGDTLLTGTTFTEFVQTLIAPIIVPTILQNKSLSAGGFSNQVLEVGTTFADTFTFNFNRGLIDNKDGQPDTLLVGAQTSMAFTGNGINATSGVISTDILLGSNQWALLLNHALGTDPYYDSNGDLATNLDADRVAGSLNTNSSTVTGRYRYWFDTGAVGTTPTNSTQVRALSTTGFATPTSFNIVIPANTREVSFYIPDTLDLSTALYVESSNADVTSTFVETAISVDDAAGNTIQYRKFTATIGGTGYPSTTTYNITIN